MAGSTLKGSSRFHRFISVGALVLLPALAQAQTARPITVAYDEVPLSRVTAAFASFSGQSITVSPLVGDPAISASVQGVRWDAGLDQLLAAHALVARPDSGGGLRIESERRITVEYQRASLRRVLADLSRFAGREITIAPDISDREVTASASGIDWQRALDRIVATTGLVVRADRLGGFLVSQ